MLEIFKTNVTDKEKASDIISLLKQHFPHWHINFDLHDCDKIPGVAGANIPVYTIIELLTSNGFSCTLLN